MQMMMIVEQIFLCDDRLDYFDIRIVKCGVEGPLDLGVSTSAYRN
jgi:hypothetical protein